MPGPLPNPEKRRRNAPTIPTTNLPVGGFEGEIPECPYPLRAAGSAWWAWAWRTPQAAAWSDGHLYVLGRRAALEDDAATLEDVEGLNLSDVAGAENVAEVRHIVGRLASLVTGRLAIVKEMRELDDRLGLTPKGMAALRWSIAEPEKKQKTQASGRRSLHIVDAAG